MSSIPLAKWESSPFEVLWLSSYLLIRILDFESQTSDIESVISNLARFFWTFVIGIGLNECLITRCHKSHFSHVTSAPLIISDFIPDPLGVLDDFYRMYFHIYFFYLLFYFYHIWNSVHFQWSTNSVALNLIFNFQNVVIFAHDIFIENYRISF